MTYCLVKAAYFCSDLETLIIIILFFIHFSRNLLSTLPKYLFDLPLKVLVISNNKLVSIPEEIGKLKDLMELVSQVVVLIVYGMHHVCFCIWKDSWFLY